MNKAIKMLNFYSLICYKMLNFYVEYDCKLLYKNEEKYDILLACNLQIQCCPSISKNQVIHFKEGCK